VEYRGCQSSQLTGKILRRDPAAVLAIIRSGSERAHDTVASVLSDVREVFFLNDHG
jgi:phosphohistidine phosphatase SixA